jgi:hypothetical protein
LIDDFTEAVSHDTKPECCCHLFADELFRAASRPQRPGVRTRAIVLAGMLSGDAGDRHSNLFTISNPSAVTFPRFNADNTVSSLDAASFRAAIGAGSGGGSVTSVAGTGSANGLTLSGTVTTSGNITLGGSVTSLTTTNFTIAEEGGKLVIKYGATVVASFSSAGALISADNITAYGTP